MFRMIHCSIWNSAYFGDLDKDSKLLYIYLFSNMMTKNCGIYEITYRQICFDTGISREGIEKILKKFEADGKVNYDGKEICVHNYIKRQANRSPKVKIRILKDLSEVKNREFVKLIKARYEDYFKGFKNSEIEKKSETEKPEKIQDKFQRESGIRITNGVKFTDLKKIYGYDALIEASKRWKDYHKRFSKSKVRYVVANRFSKFYEYIENFASEEEYETFIIQNEDWNKKKKVSNTDIDVGKQYAVEDFKPGVEPPDQLKELKEQLGSWNDRIADMEYGSKDHLKATGIIENLELRIKEMEKK